MTATTTISKEKKINLASEAEKHVHHILGKKLPNHVYFHDLHHTLQIKKAAKKLAKKASLNEEEKEALVVASLFQFTGYVKNDENYWKKSVAIAESFLQKNNASQKLIDDVKKLIALLSPGSEPDTFTEKLFLDAHHSYLGKKSYTKRLRRLRKEKEEISGEKTSMLEWQKEQMKKLSRHVFYTQLGEELFGTRKLKNLEKIKDGHKKSLKIKSEREKMTSVSANSGARTLFKTALRNHIDLTAIADQKANIMLSINALIITIGLPAFSTYLSGTSYLIIPAVIFLLTSAATMILATLSTRPIKMNGETDLSKLLTGKTNLFFFGNFYKLRRDDYQESIKKIVADRNYLDTSFINDLFYLGLSLGDKYRLLRICYTVFVAGVSLSVLSFVIAYIVSKY